MQNGVFNAADILIYRQPVISLLAVEHSLRIVGTSKASVIPGRLHKGIEGICLALAGLVFKCELSPRGIRLDRRDYAIHDNILRQ